MVGEALQVAVDGSASAKSRDAINMFGSFNCSRALGNSALEALFQTCAGSIPGVRFCPSFGGADALKRPCLAMGKMVDEVKIKIIDKEASPPTSKRHPLKLSGKGLGEPKS